MYRKDIAHEACECLKWKYKGNEYVESGEMKLAIDAYNEALEICEDYAASTASDPNTAANSNSIVLKQQEGIILLMRASAYLQQAHLHKEELQQAMAEDDLRLPSSETLLALLSGALSPSPPVTPSDSSSSPNAAADDEIGIEDGTASGTKANDSAVAGATDNSTLEGVNGISESGSDTDNVHEQLPLSSSSHGSIDAQSRTHENDPQIAVRLSVLRKLQSNGIIKEAQLRKIRYRHGLYQTSLLRAARDTLRATEVLPDYSKAWLRAGELLSDLWKTKESKQYYEKALLIDGSLEESLGPVLEGLEERQELVDRARANNNWPDDSLQLALDIAG